LAVDFEFVPAQGVSVVHTNGIVCIDLGVSWEHMLTLNVKTIHPVHGDAFPVEVMQQEIARRQAG
jgi:hypothetical protein